LTLSEILLALALLSITLLALAALQASILKGRQKSTVNVYAAKVAAALMVTIETQLASDIEADVSQVRSEVPPEILLDTPYQFEYEVTQSFDGPPEQGLKDVSVTVYWKDKNGEQKRTLWSKFVEQ
jgi:Tfp pilus assembly protein PilV